MPYVVTEGCIQCKHTDCVAACPADAFREGENFLVIAPDFCIDCALCVPACPEKAIFAEGDVPAGQEAFIALNAELAQDWELIISKKAALPAAAQWSGVAGKLQQLSRLPIKRTDGAHASVIRLPGS